MVQHKSQTAKPRLYVLAPGELRSVYQSPLWMANAGLLRSMHS